MEQNQTCPVCGKAGIPDYHSQDIVCPCCGSDLSIYRVIDQIPERKSGGGIWKIIAAVALLMAGVCFFLWLNKGEKTDSETEVQTTGQKRDSLQRENERMRTDLTAQITVLKDSVDMLRDQLSSEGKAAVTTPDETDFYVVEYGDSYWSICKKCYGNGALAPQLAEQNHRTMDTPLYVGDTLYIAKQ